MNRSASSSLRMMWGARIALAAMLIVLVLLLAFRSFYVYAPHELPGLASTIIGTFIGALLAAVIPVAIYLRTEGNRLERLLVALVSELHATVDRLHTLPSTVVPDPADNADKKQELKVVLAHIEPTACEEAIRNGILGPGNPDNIFRLTHLARLMHEYTKFVDVLLPLVVPQSDNRHDQARAYALAQQLKGLEHFVIDFCKTVLKGLEGQGVEAPSNPKFYSDHSRSAPEDYIYQD